MAATMEGGRRGGERQDALLGPAGAGEGGIGVTDADMEMPEGGATTGAANDAVTVGAGSLASGPGDFLAAELSGALLPLGQSPSRAGACLHRAKACVADQRQYIKARREAYSLALLRRFPSLMLLAAWHTYGVWLAFCAIVSMAGSTLLSWYIGWYQLVPVHGDPDGKFPYFHFFALFLRSWLLVCVASELCRFCYLLFRDAWSLDTFGGYRRALCGCGHVDMWSHNVQDSLGYWPPHIFSWQRKLDCLLQWAIYASFDVAPLLYSIVSFCCGGLWAAQIAAFQALLSVALVHSVLYFVAWLVTDVVLKVRSFSKAWQADHGELPDSQGGPPQSLGGLRHQHRPEPDAAQQQPEADGATEEPSATSLWGRVRAALRAVALQRRLVPVAQEEPARDVTLQPTIETAPSWYLRNRNAVIVDPMAEEMNQCVHFCGWLDVVTWEALFVAAVAGLILAAVIMKTLLILVLCLVGLPTVLFWRCRWAFAQGPWSQSRLQRWGEEKCSLGPWERWSVHTSFGLVLILQGAIFANSNEWPGVWVCVLTLLAVLLREVALHFERNNGWWIGLAEGFGIWSVVSLLNLLMLGRDSFYQSLVLSCLHQCGMQRLRPTGSRLVKSIFALMYIVLILIVGVTMLSVVPAETSTWSAFTPNGRNFTVGRRSVGGHGLVCEGRFASGAPDASFSIADFGLFSALAYESEKSMPRSLEHYFPGWWVLYTRFAGDMRIVNSEDWTTFFEFSDPENTTSVFAIRGTDTTLDVLSDINIWLTAALTQGFQFIGPWMLASVSEAVTFWSDLVRGDESPEGHFAELLAYVETRKAAEPSRQFYITGHSLGGGLAKLVATQVDIQAITFMAPGVGRTFYSIFKNHTGADSLRRSVLTVQPDHDIVSRIDLQMGTVVPTKCDMDPLSCHMIYPAAVCKIFQQCGSMRSTSVDLPCGQCPSMCP